jgi:hypothetical protein
VRLFSRFIFIKLTRLFWWFRVVRSLLPYLLGWLSPSAESPMVGADVKPYLSCHTEVRSYSIRLKLYKDSDRMFTEP